MPSVYLLPYLYSDVMLVWLTVEPMWRTDNKVYQLILSKADLLSCLSTTMGLEHEPLLMNRVVNPQQPKFGAQCGAHGWCTGPHTLRCNTQLLGDIASHPQLRRQHHQLAHVGHPVANNSSHTKNDFFQQKNTSQHTTFTVRPTGQYQAVCNTIIHTNRAGELCQVTNGGHCDLWATIHSIPRGNVETMRNPTVKREVLMSSWDGLAAYQERWYQAGPTQADEEYCAVNFVIVPGALNSNSARGTEHLWCHGNI